jgi:Family of unknown function (DUF6516)
MSIDDYLAGLDAKLKDIAALISSSTVQREIDANAEIGFITGQIIFGDGSRLEFTEQLPTDRRKFRLHYMDSSGTLIARWDSAPHHKEIDSFPFHKHTPQQIEAHGATTTLDVLEEISRMVTL